MKILFCIECLSYGGAEKNLCMVANEMVERKHSVSILNFNTAPTVQKLNKNIKIYEMPAFNRKGVKRMQQINYMSKLVKKVKPDVIISFLFMPNFVSSITGKLTATPVIISERGNPYVYTSITSKLMYKVYSLARGAVFQTEGAKAYFGKGLQKRSCIIPNPIAIKEYPKQFAISKSIAFSARFEVKQKRQDLMVEAFDIIHQQFPDYTLDFYGDGPDENRIKEMVNAKKLTKKVIFHGASHNILQDIAKSEIFVLSSDYEGIPNVLLEAMAIGMPCVATDCEPGGARLLIKSGENGIIVERDNADKLADAIIELINNANLREKYGKNARKVTEEFSMKRILDKWEEYIIQIAKK